MIFRLDEEDINPSGLDDVPEDINDIDPPANILQPDGRRVRVDELRGVQQEIIKTHPLGARVHVQAFNGVRDNEGVDPAAVEDPDEEDECDG